MLKPLRLDENGKPISACEYSTPFPSEEENYVMSGEDYAYFLKKCFSLYLKDFVDGKYTSIRQFDNFVRLAHHEIPEQCGMDGHCCHQFVIEGDGEVYPCDFYCIDCYDMGNINDTDFFALSKHPIATQFIKESMQIDENARLANIMPFAKRLQTRAYRHRQMRCLQAIFRLRLAPPATHELTILGFLTIFDEYIGLDCGRQGVFCLPKVFIDELELA